MPMSPPDLFTVTEAATVLRIGRTTAYELARRDLATGGGEGLGVVRIGGQLRIPRVALERIVGRSLTGPAGDVDQGGAVVLPHAVVPDSPTAFVETRAAAIGRARRTVSVDQLRFDA
jgi:hypothetical protein